MCAQRTAAWLRPHAWGPGALCRGLHPRLAPQLNPKPPAPPAVLRRHGCRRASVSRRAHCCRWAALPACCGHRWARELTQTHGNGGIGHHLPPAAAVGRRRGRALVRAALQLARTCSWRGLTLHARSAACRPPSSGPARGEPRRRSHLLAGLLAGVLHLPLELGHRIGGEPPDAGLAGRPGELRAKGLHAAAAGDLLGMPPTSGRVPALGFVCAGRLHGRCMVWGRRVRPIGCIDHGLIVPYSEQSRPRPTQAPVPQLPKSLGLGRPLSVSPASQSERDRARLAVMPRCSRRPPSSRHRWTARSPPPPMPRLRRQVHQRAAAMLGFTLPLFIIMGVEAVIGVLLLGPKPVNQPAIQLARASYTQARLGAGSPQRKPRHDGHVGCMPQGALCHALGAP